MYLSNLKLNNFKTYTECDVDFCPNVNCLVGNNGVGKTNILDAIYYLSFCKSNLLSNDALNVKHGENAFILQGLYETESGSLKISCSYNQDEKSKVIKCNDKKYQSVRHYIAQSI